MSEEKKNESAADGDTLVKDPEVAEAEAASEEQTENDGEAGQEEQPQRGRLLPKLRLVGDLTRKSMKSPTGRIALLAVVFFVGFSIFAAFYLRGRLEPTEETAEEETPQIEEVVAPAPDGTGDMSPKELIAVAKTALKEKDHDRAIRLLDAAHMKAERDDVATRHDLFVTMTQACQMAGQEFQAEIHEAYVTRLELEIGSSIPILREADDAFDRGDLSTARKLYYRFLLRENDLKVEKTAWASRAADRLAEIMRLEFEKSSKGVVPVLSSEPEGFFR